MWRGPPTPEHRWRRSSKWQVDALLDCGTDGNHSIGNAVGNAVVFVEVDIAQGQMDEMPVNEISAHNEVPSDFSLDADAGVQGRRRFVVGRENSSPGELFFVS